MASSLVTLSRPFASHRTSSPSFSTAPTVGEFSAGFKRNSLKVNAISTKYEPSKVVPQADRVLIRLEALAEKSAGGVLLPKSAVNFERYLVGEIVSVGTEAEEVETGKKVLFSDINAYEVDLGTVDRHVFCKASELLAVLE